MSLKDEGRAFVDSLVGRDFVGLEDQLGPGVRFRGLLPSGPFEENGPADAVGRFRFWYGDADTVDVLRTDVSDLPGKFRVSYLLRVHGSTPAGDGVHLIEQHVFGAPGDGGIASLDLVCSGFRRHPETTTA